MQVVRNTVVAFLLPVILLFSVTVRAANTVSSTDAAEPNQGAMNRFYAVTLMTSFSPVSTKKLSKEFPKYVVYQKKTVVFGKDLYLIRLGFFRDFSDATVMKKLLAARFPGAWATEVPEAEQANALGIGVVAPSSVARATAPAAASRVKAGKAAGSGIYVLNLDNARVPEKLVRKPMPIELNAYRAYALAETTKGKTLYHYRLGFFPSRADAEQARSFLTRAYPDSSIVQVSREEQVLATSAPAGVGAPHVTQAAGLASATPAVSAAQNVEIDNQAGKLLAEGRDHITSGDYIAAIRVLNRLLTLPHNKFTNDAIEYIGVARERGGQFTLARDMYETYLRVNPDSEGAERVRQRLASMAGGSGEAVPALRPVKDSSVPVKSVFGSLSQTYYRGDTTIGAPSLTPTQPVQTIDTQHSLISFLDLTARYQSSNYDNRVILRDQYTNSWLSSTPSKNYLSAAYLELKDKKRDYSARFGRQPGNTGGVLGMFDGASATYNITPTWHISGNTGIPKEVKVNARRYFYSLSTDFGPVAQRWYGGFYYVYQFVEGVEDRNAVGAELRYFEPRHSLYTLFDYDLGFSALNIAVLQANWQTESNTSYNLLIDHRKSPALQATNVLIGATDPSGTRLPTYSELSNLYTADQLREFSKLHTPESNYYDFSVTHPVTQKLQLGAGVNMYSFSESLATPVALAVPGTGNTFVYSLRAIGTGLVFDKDISVLTLSHTHGETLQGNGVALTNKSIFQGKWTVDLGLRLAKQTSSFPGFAAVENTTADPSIRFGYRFKQSVVLETEYGQERNHAKDTSTGSETITTSKYYSVGYHWTF